MSITILNSWASSWTNIRGHMASAEREPIMGVWCCHMSEMALNCYVYELFMVINGCCSTNMCARQLSFNFSSMVLGGGSWPRGPPFGSAPGPSICLSQVDGI